MARLLSIKNRPAMDKLAELPFFLQYINVEMRLKGFGVWQKAFKKFRDKLDVDVCKSLLEVARQSTLNKEDMDWITFHEAEILFLRLKNEQAESRLLNILGSTQSKIVNANARNKLADLQRTNGLYDIALQNYNISLELFLGSGDFITRATVVHMIGVTYWAKGEYELAESYFQQSLAEYQYIIEHWESMNTEICNFVRSREDIQRHKANVMRDLGDLYRKTARLDEAEKCLIQSRSILESSQELNEVQMTYLSIAKLFREKENWSECIEYNLKAYEISRELHSTINETEALFRLAEAYYLTKQYHIAKEWANKAFSAAKDYNLPYFCSRSSRLLGLINLETGKIQVGINNLISAIGFAYKFSPNLMPMVVSEINGICCRIKVSHPKLALKLERALLLYQTKK